MHHIFSFARYEVRGSGKLFHFLCTLGPFAAVKNSSKVSETCPLSYEKQSSDIFYFFASITMHCICLRKGYTVFPVGHWPPDYHPDVIPSLLFFDPL